MEKEMNVYLVRHGMSIHNVFDQYMQGKLDLKDLPPAERDIIISISEKDRKFPENKKLKFDLRLIDPPLSEFGIAQAKAGQEAANALDVKYVFVSPLLRALQTSRIMFENHPKKESIKFVVLPIIRETISSMNDVPYWTLRETRKKFEEIPGMHYDFSMFDEIEKPNLYFLYTLNEEERKKVLERIEKEGEENHVTIVQEVMLSKKTPGHKHYCKLETYHNARERGLLFVAWLRKFIQEKGVKSEQVVVVAHSSFLCHMTATEFNEYGRVKVFNKPPFSVPYLFDLNKVPLHK